MSYFSSKNMEKVRVCLVIDFKNNFEVFENYSLFL